MCPCSENADCDNDLCIWTPDGNRCARTCVSDCPAGYKCIQTTPKGSGGKGGKGGDDYVRLQAAKAIINGVHTGKLSQGGL
jgi:hypothetical protein